MTDNIRALAAAYVAAVEHEPEKDCWDTETGKYEEGAEKFASDWSWKAHDDAKQKAFDDLRAALTAPAWNDMATAPKDGTILRLLVVPDKEEFTAFDDSLTPFETIGFNNLADTEEDRWEFAGWHWSQDCFITGRGEVIGWSLFAHPTLTIDT